MKGKAMAAVLLLGTAAFAALALAAELHLLPETWTGLAPYAFVAAGALLLILAWRGWPKLMAWVFKQEEQEPMK